MTPEWAGPLCAFLSSCTWSIGSARYADLSLRHSAFAVNFTRALVALPLFIIAIFVVGGGIEGGLANIQELGLRHLGWFGLSMIACYGLGDALFLWSAKSLGVPGALAIASTYPLFTGLADWLILGHPVSAAHFGGLLMMVGGVVVVILSVPRSVDRLRSNARTKGVLLAFATSVLWAVNTYAVSRGGRDISAPVGSSVRMILALFISPLLGMVLAKGMPATIPFRVVRRWGWLFALEAFGGSYLFIYGLAHSSFALGSVLTSLSPVISVPIAWAMGIEKFSWARTLGVVGVVGGLMLLLS